MIDEIQPLSSQELVVSAQEAMKQGNWMSLEEATAVCTAFNGKRRGKLQMTALEDAIHHITEKYNVITLRGLFYQITSKYLLLPKVEKSYKTIARISGDMRKRGLLAYEKMSDNTRWSRKPRTHRNLQSALASAQQFYRRDLWATQDAYVEIWCEKDAMAGVLYEVTEKYDVPLMISRGYASLSFLHSASQAIDRVNSEGKHAYLYHYGDYDPSGENIPRVIAETLRSMVNDPQGFTFEVKAVLPDQIRNLNLPTRPTKKQDSRSKNFEGDSVELDATEPDVLQAMVTQVIESHIDQNELQRIQNIEQAERESLRNLIVNL